MTEKGKEIANWSDESMFKAEKIESKGPEVYLLSCNSDPLGTIAACAGAYQGKFYKNLSEITDEDRRYYITDMEKNILGMPSEAVQFHFVIKGVTRAFTHQLVRQRVGASYAQESMRFAVKDDFPVALPPSLMGTISRDDWRASQTWVPVPEDMKEADWLATEERFADEEQRMRFKWDEAVNGLGDTYLDLIDMGMPAEDARGLAPTAILTQINYVTTLRGLMDHAGLRLCTQAQFEWKQVWAKILEAIRDYGATQSYRLAIEGVEEGGMYQRVPSSDYPYSDLAERASSWQFDLLADRFKPICYRTGKCEFMSDFDRYCPIRERVQANHKIGRPSKEWGEPAVEWVKQEFHNAADGLVMEADGKVDLGIPAIRTEDWLSPFVAIRKDGSWRTEEQKKNIANRRL